MWRFKKTKKQDRQELLSTDMQTSEREGWEDCPAPKNQLLSWAKEETQAEVLLTDLDLQCSVW